MLSSRVGDDASRESDYDPTTTMMLLLLFAMCETILAIESNDSRANHTDFYAQIDSTYTQVAPSFPIAIVQTINIRIQYVMWSKSSESEKV